VRFLPSDGTGAAFWAALLARSHEGCGRSDIESGGCEAKAAADAKASLSLATERKLTAAVGSKADEELKAAADAALMPFKSGNDCRAENSGLLLLR